MYDNMTAVILAAGLSRRMGPTNKLLVDIEGLPMLRRSVQPYLRLGLGEIVVVTGHERDKIEACLAGFPLRFVYNPVYANGQKTSVSAGLMAVKGQSDVLIGLGDQPFIAASDLEWLIVAHKARSAGRITYAAQGNSRGNPIVVPAALRSCLLEDKVNPGCHGFTRKHPELTHPIKTDRPGFFHDLDCRADLAILANAAEDAL